MPLSRRYGFLALTTFALLFTSIAAPAQAGSGCVDINARNLGTGLGVYVITDALDAIGVMVASGAPGEGVTMSLIVSPSLCAGGGSIPLPGGLIPPIGTSTVNPVPDAPQTLPVLP